MISFGKAIPTDMRMTATNSKRLPRTGIPMSTGIAVLFFLALTVAHARIWTSSDDTKTFEGDLKSYDEASGAVTVTLASGKDLTFSQGKLSKVDVEWLKANGTKLSAGTSTVAVGELPDVLPDPDGKEADMSQPVQVYILLGQSNMLGFGKISGGDGSLENAVKSKDKYPYLVDESGSWTERKDVRNVRVMVGKGGMQVFNNEWMTIKGKAIGPEMGIGHYVGQVTDAPVMILKSCIGNRSLGWDLLPPGSESYEFEGKKVPGYRGTPDNPEGNGEKVEDQWYAGKQYDDDTENAKKVLADLDKYYPGAKSYEIAGFFFWQGAKDSGSKENSSRYEKNLVQFIKSLRKDFEAPNAKFVVATMGQTKKGAGGNEGLILEAQLAVDGEAGKYDEFKGNVASVYSNPFCHGGSANGHYSGNAETFMDIGEAMGKAMVGLLSGK
jgi:hypothetical protein